MKATWRIIETPACDPYANMALDEALLRSYLLHAAPPTVRIYSWDRPSISLGYAQEGREVLDTGHCAAAGIPMVRRLTGGGVILHDREVTYSLVCVKEDLGIGSGVLASYRRITSFLIEFYRRLGLAAAYAGDAAPGEAHGARAGLCFAAKEKYDIVIGGKKIGGNAQRRSRGAIFQHGSIPLALDREAVTRIMRDRVWRPKMEAATALDELLDRAVLREELSPILIDSFRSTFGCEAVPGSLSGAEEKLYNNLLTMKYCSRAWNDERIDITALKERVHDTRHYATPVG